MTCEMMGLPVAEEARLTRGRWPPEEEIPASGKSPPAAGGAWVPDGIWLPGMMSPASAPGMSGGQAVACRTGAPATVLS
jgi:hypothetical protein